MSGRRNRDKHFFLFYVKEKHVVQVFMFNFDMDGITGIKVKRFIMLLFTVNRNKS